MKIENFRKGKGNIICSFDLQLSATGPGIRDFRIIETNGDRWVAHPARQFTNEEGKKKYFSYTFFPAQNKDAFDKEVMALVEPFLQDSSSEVPF